MKTQNLPVVFLALFAPLLVFAQTSILPDLGKAARQFEPDILQFNNLTIQSVSGTTAPATIVATASRAEAEKRCLKFPSVESVRGETVPCPAPSSLTYTIRVGADTILMLRDRGRATLADFEAGNQLNVFGFYNVDGTIEGLIVRNLSKPIEKQFIQLNNVEVIGILESQPKAFVVIHRSDYFCNRFQGERKRDIPCPLGLRSEDVERRLPKIPEDIRPQLERLRKYEVRLTRQTIVLDRTKTKMDVEKIAVGDKLNVYGSYQGENAEVIEAEIIRDLSRPPAAEAGRAEGVITQINESDGSFVIRTRSGDLITVASPFFVGAFVSVKGVLNELKKAISEVTEIVFRKLTEKDAVPIVSQIIPGSGPVGTRVTLQGFGFTATGNDITFAGVPRALTNLSSPDGKTLLFAIPATPCAPETVCAQVVLKAGNYELSVVNKNGVSNSVSFRVGELPPLAILTTSVPQVVENQKYEFALKAQGGIGSYDWKVTSGTLPPGITLLTGACITAPCQLPATLSGIPTTPGTYTFTVALTAGGETVSRNFTLVVVQAISTGY